MSLLIFIFNFSMTLSNVFGQIDVELSFKNSCNDSIYKSDYDIYYKSYEKWKMLRSDGGKIILPNVGRYYLFGSYLNKGYNYGFYYGEIFVEKSLVDTLLIPKISNKQGPGLDSKFIYTYCEKICNGIEKEFYVNGNIWTEGEFIDGMPKWTIHYRIDGTKESEYWYNIGNILPSRVNRYNEKGQLWEYEIKEFKKRKTVVKFYDSNGKLIDHN